MTLEKFALFAILGAKFSDAMSYPQSDLDIERRNVSSLPHAMLHRVGKKFCLNITINGTTLASELPDMPPTERNDLLETIRIHIRKNDFASLETVKQLLKLRIHELSKKDEIVPSRGVAGTFRVLVLGIIEQLK